MQLTKLFKQGSIYLVGDLLRRGIGFLMIPFYTRYLSQSDYGFIELLDLSLLVAGVCFGITALSDGMVRIYYDYADDESRNHVVSTAVLSSSMAGFLVAALAALSAVPLSHLIAGNAQYASMIRAGFAALMFTAIGDIALVYQRIRRRAVFFVVFSAVQVILNLALNVYLIVNRHLGLWGFVLSKLIVASVAAVCLLIVLLRETGIHFRLPVATQIFRFAGPLIVSGVAVFIIHFSDRYFLQHFADLATVGVYALAYKCGFLVTYLVGQPFENVWGVTLYAEVGTEEWRHRFARTITYITFCLLSVAVLLGVFSDRIIALAAPPSYAAAAMLVPLIAFAYAFREVGDFFRGLLFVDKQVRNFGGITVACAIFNLALNASLIPRFHALGAAWATVLTWCVYMAACWLIAQKSVQIPYSLKAFVMIGGLAILACVGAGYLRMLPPLWGWLGDFGIAGCFVGLVWILGYFNTQERHFIRQHLAIGWQTLTERLL